MNAPRTFTSVWDMPIADRILYGFQPADADALRVAFDRVMNAGFNEGLIARMSLAQVWVAGTLLDLGSDPAQLLTRAPTWKLREVVR